MKIRITEKLKAFRKEHGNTQEELASHLNISVQAVSKWERGEGFPDISLLPSIAAYYGRTVDELLGCSEIEKAGRIGEYLRQYKENGTAGRVEENIALMRKALKEFPEETALLSELCHALLFGDKEEYCSECIKTGERLLEKSTDDRQRFETIQMLAYACMRSGNEEKAREYAEKLPDLYCSVNTVLEGILQGEELQQLAQSNIMQHIRLIDLSVSGLLRSREYTPEEKILALETVDQLYRLFLYDGNYGMEHAALHLLWMNLAREYGKLRDAKKTIAALQRAYSHAQEMDHFKPGRYTSLFADKVEYSKELLSRNFEKVYVEWLENVMQEDTFDFIRGSKEWKEFMELVK